MINRNLKEGAIEMERRHEHPYWLWEAMMGSSKLLKACLDEEGVQQIDRVVDEILHREPKNFFLIGTGSSRFAGMVTVQALKEIAGIHAVSVNTMEFGAYPPLDLGKDSIVIITSHSGNTPGDIPVIKMIRNRGAYSIGITNVKNAPLAKNVEDVILGPDTPVLKLRLTRSYPGNIFRGIQLAIALARRMGREILAEQYERELFKTPAIMEVAINDFAPRAPEVARKLLGKDAYFAIAAGPNMSTAHEAALGFYQGTGIGATPLQVEEFLHGSIQALTSNMAVVFIAAPGPLQGRILLAEEAVRKLGADTVLIAPEGTAGLEKSPFGISMPGIQPELLTPLTYTGPLWLIGYYFSLLTNRDPDYMEMTDKTHQEVLALLMPAGSQFDRWSGRID